MAKRPRASILIVDDKPDALRALRSNLKAFGLRAELKEPSELTIDDLKAADLVLVDHDLGAFSSTGGVTTAPNGIALCGILRQRLREEEDDTSPTNVSPTGFALFTAKLDHAAYPLPRVVRRHLLARQNNLEWVFSKTDERLEQRINSLGRAISEIPRSWGDGISDFTEIAAALGVSAKGEDLEPFERVVREAHPPIFELTKWNHGIAIIRWLLHDILEYPCFLWDSVRVAARLRISHGAFSRTANGRSKLTRALESMRYTGMLSDFGGPRWWRHEIEEFVWDVTKGQTQDSEQVHKSVSRLAGKELEPCGSAQPVVCLDDEFRATSKPVEMSEAVRLQLDDWPPFADAAWMRTDLVHGNSELVPLVLQQDREKVK